MRSRLNALVDWVAEAGALIILPLIFVGAIVAFPLGIR